MLIAMNMISGRLAVGARAGLLVGAVLWVGQSIWGGAEAQTSTARPLRASAAQSNAPASFNSGIDNSKSAFLKARVIDQDLKATLLEVARIGNFQVDFEDPLDAKVFNLTLSGEPSSVIQFLGVQYNLFIYKDGSVTQIANGDTVISRTIALPAYNPSEVDDLVRSSGLTLPSNVIMYDDNGRSLRVRGSPRLVGKVEAILKLGLRSPQQRELNVIRFGLPSDR